jgi:membrane protein YdbS with pleckstrin-like domain
MQAFDQIQELWQKHEVEVKVSADEMLQQAKKEVNGLKLKSALNIGGMLLSFIAIAALWIFFHFESWTTHVGISITIIAIGVYTLILYRDYRLIAKNDFTAHPNEFLNNLKTYQLNRYKLYNSLYWFYMVALSLGLIFYFVEILAHFNTAQKVIAVGLTALWMIFCSTILRKAVMKREKERIALLIEKFERISGQISTPEQF